MTTPPPTAPTTGADAATDQPHTSEPAMTQTGPDQCDVDALRDLLDLMADFPNNDQRARYLLTCNWFVEEGGAVAQRAALNDMAFWAERTGSVEP